MGAKEPIVARPHQDILWLLVSSQYNSGLSLDHASEWLSLWVITLSIQVS